jgi:hypothetical protein
LISVIENNINKNLIVSMSIEQRFRYQKGKKEKRPLILIYSNERFLKELKCVSSHLLYFLSIETLYY